MRSRMPLVYQLQEMDRIIFEAEQDMEVTWDTIFELYHTRAELNDKYEWYMTPWR